MERIKVIDSGTLKVKDINKLKLFPRELYINRAIDKKHVNSIKKSMKKLYIPPIIKVNKDMFIIDGQHVYHALIELAEEDSKFNDYEINYDMYDTQGNDRKACMLT